MATNTSDIVTKEELEYNYTCGICQGVIEDAHAPDVCQHT
jgi:hypothetical protein